ncbi:MAG: penicillin-binding protein 1C [Bacteroidia bacterium]|nr:penicillin-binding protein 1C [Bacteroidia bacterium]
MRTLLPRLRLWAADPQRKPWQKGLWRHKGKLSLLFLLAIWFAFSLPSSLFNDPVSTVVLDRNGSLLGARIAADGQWRFPKPDSVPEKFAQSLIVFEDKRFYSHPGVDPLALARAVRLNFSHKGIVSGGSTLTMQVIRLSRKGQSRSFLEKLKEMFLAMRLELRLSKAEILRLYAANAPFGGNVVGIDAASWKYFGREAYKLSWSESATLAVLPNAPSLIHPGKNREILLAKRNRLLRRLYETGVIDSTTARLAQLEDLPEKPLPIPSYAPHLLEQIHLENEGEKKEKTLTRTTLQQSVQIQASDIVRRRYTHFQQNGIHNAAALILEVETGDVVAYVGNTPCEEGENGCAVDLVMSRRSTGSIMKPFLFASMLNDGELLPGMLVPDIPSHYSGFSPTNYDRTYSGAVPARRALSRSLNIPAVRLLKDHGIAKFLDILRDWGITSLNRSADDYGLTLILGGGEASLWELAGVYASMSRTLANYREYNGRYDPAGFHSPNYYQEKSVPRLDPSKFDRLQKEGRVSAAAVWFTFEAMVAVTRPENESFWENFSSSDRIAWKTGTSYGNRDAWAVGCTPEYVVAVWVGNADGEGRTGLTGATAAAPVMFDLFNTLGYQQSWFSPPLDEMIQVPLCRQSGHRVQENCTEADTTWIPLSGIRTPLCPYHERINLDRTGTFRVHSDCESPLNMQQRSFFILPPVQEVYYRSRNPDYILLPDYREDCQVSGLAAGRMMAVVYPGNNARIYVPTELDGKPGSTVFEVAHRDRTAQIYWHIDEDFMGMTKEIHEMSLNPPPGKHLLTLIDNRGESLSIAFEILSESEKK